MGERTKIQWCSTVGDDGHVYPGYTYNHWEGCTEISPACMNCYAEARNMRFHGGRHWGVDAPRRLSSATYQKQPARWDARARDLGIRLKVFGGSLMDFADNEVDPAWRDALWRIIRETPALDWLMLTKRIPNLPRIIPADWGESGYANVWLGASVWDTKSATRDIPRLLRVPARLHWISAGPMLGPVSVPRELLAGLDFVAIEGESGARARPFCVEWALGLVEDCRLAGVPVFVKQLGRYPVWSNGESLKLADKKGGDPDEWPDRLKVRQFAVRVDSHREGPTTAAMRC